MDWSEPRSQFETGSQYPRQGKGHVQADVADAQRAANFATELDVVPVLIGDGIVNALVQIPSGLAIVRSRNALPLVSDLP